MADEAPDELTRLMIGYQNGQLEAFESLYRAMAPPLLRYVNSFVRNASIAEELLQDTFLQVHRARHTYLPPRPVKPWLYAIARHVALMYLRSTKRRSKHEILADEELPELPISPAAEDLGDTLLVRRSLADLDPAQREILVLHHMLGLSFKEIGAVLGTTAGAAKVRAHRAIKVLRERLQPQES